MGSLKDQQQQQPAMEDPSNATVGAELECHPNAPGTARAASVDAAVSPKEAKPGHQQEQYSYEAMDPAALTEAAVEQLHGKVDREEEAEGEAGSVALHSNSKVRPPPPFVSLTLHPAALRVLLPFLALSVLCASHMLLPPLQLPQDLNQIRLLNTRCRELEDEVQHLR